MHTVVGHSAHKETLLSNVENVASWLLCGNRGIGKASVSRAFAKHVTQSNELEAHPDVMIIESDTEPVGIDRARNMRRFLEMTAIKSQKKIVIVDSIDNMNVNAASALLKTLEEPPKESIILLISHNLLSVPLVIRSRCIVLHFKELSRQETEQVLRSNFSDPELADKAAFLYSGTPGMVTEDIDQEILLYNLFMSVMYKKADSCVGDILETALPIHKVEHVLLKAMANAIDDVLRLEKTIEPRGVSRMLDRYSKVQEIFSASRKLRLHREITILRVVEVIGNLVTCAQPRLP